MSLLKRVDYTEDYKVSNNLRTLSIDMINNAKSGHPGICLGASDIIYTLYAYHLKINRNDPNWINRDRFVLSAGHGAPLLYSTLYMLGYLELDDLKYLRKLDSKTPGHPETSTIGVDMSTGPLGQGISSSVGLAIAERYLNNHNKLIDHYTYCLCGDGDLEEGISYEALNIASRLKLNKLIILYDSNDVTLDGKLSNSSEEDIITRFKSLNFNIVKIDGHDIGAINKAITSCKSSNMPSIIICKTTIGKYSVNEGLNTVHGKPLAEEDISSIKQKLDIYDGAFAVSQDSVDYFRDRIDSRMNLEYKEWLKRYNIAKPNLIEELELLNNPIYEIKDIDFPYKDISLREVSGTILNTISKEFNLIIGGSCDLSSSCKTVIDGNKFEANNYSGRNIDFGIREHAMGAILNGLALHGLRPFGSTFLVFSDYVKPAIRLSSLMNLGVTYIFTHDSFTVGEDGATHHPIEQLMSLELIPNLYVYRPFDANELISCYKEIYQNNRPSVLVLPRESKEISELTKSNKVNEGAYILKKEETDNFITLIGNGEELGLILKVSDRLKELDIDTRIVSMPCRKLYIENDKNIISEKSVAITYTSSEYYYRFTKNVLGVDTFSKSGTKDELVTYFEKDLDNVVNKILSIYGENNEKKEN